MLETKVQFTTYALIFHRLAAYLHLLGNSINHMDKDIIFEGKIKVDDQSHKVIIASGLDEAGTARFCATVDKQPPVELLHNPDTHLW